MRAGRVALPTCEGLHDEKVGEMDSRRGRDGRSHACALRLSEGETYRNGLLRFCFAVSHETPICLENDGFRALLSADAGKVELRSRRGT
jgi:hypothetical protein